MLHCGPGGWYQLSIPPVEVLHIQENLHPYTLGPVSVRITVSKCFTHSAHFSAKKNILAVFQFWWRKLWSARRVFKKCHSSLLSRLPSVCSDVGSLVFKASSMLLLLGACGSQYWPNFKPQPQKSHFKMQLCYLEGKQDQWTRII